MSEQPTYPVPGQTGPDLGGVVPAPGEPTGYVSPPAPGLDSQGKVQRTKSGAVWIGLIGAAVILIALLVFILQNLNDVSVHFLGFHGRVPLGIALLLSALAGLLLVSIPGTVRILQLRRALRKSGKR
jgi:uncharacterized integral membrane protein